MLLFETTGYSLILSVLLFKSTLDGLINPSFLSYL